MQIDSVKRIMDLAESAGIYLGNGGYVRYDTKDSFEMQGKLLVLFNNRSDSAKSRAFVDIDAISLIDIYKEKGA